MGPTWQNPVMLAGIFIAAVMPSLPRASNEQELIDEASLEVEAFLAGQAVGFVTGLLIFPQSCRSIFIKDVKACLESLALIIRLYLVCLDDLRAGKNSSTTQFKAELQNFTSKVYKAHSDVEDAKREPALSHLHHSHLHSLALLLVEMVPPLSGLGTTADMLEIVTSGHLPESVQSGSDDLNCISPDNANGERDDDWRQLEEVMHRHSLALCGAVVEGAQHAVTRLDLTKRRNPIDRIKGRIQDAEVQGDSKCVRLAQALESFRQIMDACECFSGDDQECADGRPLNHFLEFKPPIVEQVRHEQHRRLLRYFLMLHVRH